jgi:hypothetical protein
MPAGVHGFDYIDAVREVFAPDNKYENIVPTENQLERLSTLYVQDRKLLRADYRINTAKTDDYVVMHSWNFTAGMDGWSNFFGLSECAVTDGALKVTSDKNDFAIQSAPALGIDISKIKAIRVTMKSSVPVTSEMFFITEADTGWAQDRSASAKTEKAGEFVELVMMLDNNAAWKGKLKQLRFDPNSKPGTFEIKSIELLGEEEPERLIRGSQELIFSQFFPYADNGVMMVPFDPKQAMLTFLSCGWTWDETSKTLTVLHFDDTMTFTVGSDKSLVNGSEIKLSHKVDELDGLPVLPIQDLFKHLSISDVTVIAQ